MYTINLKGKLQYEIDSKEFKFTEVCLWSDWIGDLVCDDLTNNVLCNYDGNDCCNELSIFIFCENCTCHFNPDFVKPYEPQPPPPPPPIFISTTTITSTIITYTITGNITHKPCTRAVKILNSEQLLCCIQMCIQHYFPQFS